MTDKEKKSKIADILMDFQEEYSNEVINRPMLASLYARNILSFIDSLQEKPVSKEIGDYDHKAVMESLHPELKEEPVREDLELTWEDVRRIYLIVNSTINDVGIYNLTDKSIYQEVLRRFKALKRENNYYG